MGIPRNTPFVATAAGEVAILLGALVMARPSEDDATRAARYEEITAAPYTGWAFEPNVPAGYYLGVEPHGTNLGTP